MQSKGAKGQLGRILASDEILLPGSPSKHVFCVDLTLHRTGGATHSWCHAFVVPRIRGATHSWCHAFVVPRIRGATGTSDNPGWNLMAGRTANYSTRQGKWTELRCTGCVLSPHYGHTASLINDVMYVFGGHGVDGPVLDDLIALKLSSK